MSAASKGSLDVPHGDAVAIGVDLGGTNLRVGLIDGRACILKQQSKPTNAHRGVSAVIDDIVSMVELVCAASPGGQGISRDGFMGVGVGAPGPLSIRDGRIIRMANLPGWDDVPLRDQLRQRLGMPVSLDNDGNAAALGEYWVRRMDDPNQSGDGAEGDDLVMLTLGTGIGGGIVQGGRVLHGFFDNAAEVGHVIVERDGEPCPCGQRGCLERYASASQVVERVRNAMRAGEACALREAFESGKAITASDVARCAVEGDPVCRRVWDEACSYLAMACVNLQHLLNPARIVFGGGMALIGQPLIEAISQRFDEMTWTLHNDRPAIELSRLCLDAGIIGAAALQFFR